MKSRSLKKSLKFLTLLALGGFYPQLDAATLIGDDGITYGAPSPGTTTSIPMSSRAGFTVSISGAGGAEVINSGVLTIPSGSELNVVSIEPTTGGSSTPVTFSGAVTAYSGSKIRVLGNQAVAFTGALAGPATGSPALIDLYGNGGGLMLPPAVVAVGGATPPAGTPNISGLWMLTSCSDLSYVDVSAAGNFPPITIMAKRSIYLGSSTLGGASNAPTNNAYAFGGAGAVVMGPGTLILGTGFGTNTTPAPSATNPSLSPTFSQFTGTVVTTNTTGSCHIGSNIGRYGSLLLSGAGGRADIDVASQLASVISGNATSPILGINATVSIATLDLHKGPINFVLASGANLSISALAAGSGGTITFAGPTTGTALISLKTGTPYTLGTNGGNLTFSFT